MADSPIEKDFLDQITSIVEKNIAQENFGVSELADAMNMSRSNLLRKVKKQTKLSVSQLINQVRLKRAMEMLRKSSLNVSEVSHQVGFSSVSYFIKCFREYYGYPPGEVGKRDNEPVAPHPPSRANKTGLIAMIAFVVAAASGLFIYLYNPAGTHSLEKSIAVLPFKNESNDSTNIYLINGLMESTLNNLQQIRELKVISRTSSEKYRNTSKSIPEMARELHVNYFIEGSGQKIGDKILLNIQLIEANSDKHLWAKQYRRESKDIFQLQQEIAKNIADEIQAVITPEEEKKIKKIPTDNLEAYDQFLKGRDLLYKSTKESLEAAVINFERALELDPKFARAYGNAVITFYYLDIYSLNPKFASRIANYSDKAMLYDPKLDESLIAKALSFAYKQEFSQAMPYLEKAHEENPNSGLVLHFLTEFYAINVPNTSKYLEYALKKVKVDQTLNDSVTSSHNYFHLANAFMQSGFIDQSVEMIDKSLAYNPNNVFAGYVRAYILLAKNKDINQTKDLLLAQLRKDTTRMDVIQEVGKIYYETRDYQTAYTYFKKVIQLRELYQVDLFRHENITMAMVYAKMGQGKQAEALAENYRDFAEHNNTIYKHLSLALYYAYRKDQQKVLEEMKLFAAEDNYQYWVLMLADEPLMDFIKDLPEFKNIMRGIENKFWANHEKTKRLMEEKGLL